MIAPEERARREAEARAAAVSRRAIVLPGDLFIALEHLARRDGFSSTAAWVVVTLQAYANDRVADLPPHMR